MNVPPPTASATASRIKRSLLFTMALATAVAAANVYYCQPLLPEIGRTFNLRPRVAGELSMMPQIGYAIGLFCFVPLGDMFERRRLIVTLLAAANFAQIVAALSPDASTLYIASLMLGVFAAVVQVVVPFAATLAAPEERGAVVGFVTGGLLIGVLLARTVSGAIGGAFGWRSMYWTAAVVTGLVTLLLRYLLPEGRPEHSIRYRQLVRSLGTLIREQPIVRQAAVMGAMSFGANLCFWTALAFFLETPPYHYGAAAAGAFGLAGVTGALAAPAVGRIADRRGPRMTAGLSLVLGAVAYAILGLLGRHLMGLIVGVVLLDLAVQSNHVSNLTTIYALLPQARSRLNTIYMVTYFCGGSLGTLVAANVWPAYQWNGVCLAGAAFFTVGLGVFAWGARRPQSYESLAAAPDSG